MYMETPENVIFIITFLEKKKKKSRPSNKKKKKHWEENMWDVEDAYLWLVVAPFNSSSLTPPLILRVKLTHFTV